MLAKKTVPRTLKKYVPSVTLSARPRPKTKNRPKDDFDAYTRKRKSLKPAKSDPILSQSYHKQILNRDAILDALNETFNVTTGPDGKIIFKNKNESQSQPI